MRIALGLALCLMFAVGAHADSVDVQVAELVTVLEPVFFAPGEAEIDAAGAAACSRNVTKAKEAGDLAYVVVIGHADSRGKTKWNLKVSRRRARAVVAEYRRLGLTRVDVEPQARGKSAPVCRKKTAACLSRNRRADTFLLELSMRDRYNTPVDAPARHDTEGK